MTQATFDQQLQLVREGLDKRAAHEAMCTAFGQLVFKRFEAKEEKFSDSEIGKWFETEGARITKKWGTKIADTLVANRDLYTKIAVEGQEPIGPDFVIVNGRIDDTRPVSPDTLIVWPKAGQINKLLKFAKRWGADDSGTEKVGGKTVVYFWWD